MGKKVQTIPFDQESVQDYLDENITHWRWVIDETLLEEETEMAEHYIDAFQSVRISLFGEVLE